MPVVKTRLKDVIYPQFFDLMCTDKILQHIKFQRSVTGMGKKLAEIEKSGVEAGAPRND
jgi:hypothetical protein